MHVLSRDHSVQYSCHYNSSDLREKHQCIQYLYIQYDNMQYDVWLTGNGWDMEVIYRNMQNIIVSDFIYY